MGHRDDDAARAVCRGASVRRCKRCSSPIGRREGSTLQQVAAWRETVRSRHAEGKRGRKGGGMDNAHDDEVTCYVMGNARCNDRIEPSFYASASPTAAAKLCTV